MNDSASQHPQYGCQQCFPEDLQTASETFYKVTTIVELEQESHFSIKIRQCDSCDQRFLSVFAETIDWDDGEDPQVWSVMPLLEIEAARLTKAHADGNLMEALLRLPSDRKSLLVDFPKGRNKKINWTTGLVIGPHD